MGEPSLTLPLTNGTGGPCRYHQHGSEAEGQGLSRSCPASLPADHGLPCHHRGACPGVQKVSKGVLPAADGGSQFCSEHPSVPSARGRQAQGPLPAFPRLPLRLREGQRGSWPSPLQ